MKFEKINKNQLGDSTYYVDDRKKFINFVDDFKVVGVSWGQPTTISSDYFLRLLENGATVRFCNNDSSRKLNQFYVGLLDHGVLWKLENGKVICTAMPYGDEADIVTRFYELKNKYKHLDEITLEFLDDRYKFRKNGDRMILISVNKI